MFFSTVDSSVNSADIRKHRPLCPNDVYTKLIGKDYKKEEEPGSVPAHTFKSLLLETSISKTAHVILFISRDTHPHTLSPSCVLSGDTRTLDLIVSWSSLYLWRSH